MANLTLVDDDTDDTLLYVGASIFSIFFYMLLVAITWPYADQSLRSG